MVTGGPSRTTSREREKGVKRDLVLEHTDVSHSRLTEVLPFSSVPLGSCSKCVQA